MLHVSSFDAFNASLLSFFFRQVMRWFESSSADSETRRHSCELRDVLYIFPLVEYRTAGVVWHEKTWWNRPLDSLRTTPLLVHSEWKKERDPSFSLCAKSKTRFTIENQSRASQSDCALRFTSVDERLVHSTAILLILNVKCMKYSISKAVRDPKCDGRAGRLVRPLFFITALRYTHFQSKCRNSNKSVALILNSFIDESASKCGL